VKNFFILFAHFLSLIVKMMQPGGYRAVMAESILLKQQLIVLNRGRHRAPRLSAWPDQAVGFFVQLRLAIALPWLVNTPIPV
jgi:hypothetical protein